MPEGAEGLGPGRSAPIKTPACLAPLLQFGEKSGQSKHSVWKRLRLSLPRYPREPSDLPAAASAAGGGGGGGRGSAPQGRPHPPQAPTLGALAALGSRPSLSARDTHSSILCLTPPPQTPAQASSLLEPLPPTPSVPVSPELASLNTRTQAGGLRSGPVTRLGASAGAS